MPNEKCVMCGNETSYDVSVHIDMRYGYIEGMGQLCSSCYMNKSSRSSIMVDYRTIMDTPNDAALGEKVRRLFYESSDIKPPVGWEKI